MKGGSQANFTIYYKVTTNVNMLSRYYRVRSNKKNISSHQNSIFLRKTILPNKLIQVLKRVYVILTYILKENIVKSRYFWFIIIDFSYLETFLKRKKYV